jgi:proteasome lid subunit RPN8/RPN11
MLPLRMFEQQWDEVVAHCRQCYPKEACGILAGSAEPSLPEDQLRLVLQVYPMKNAEDSPIGYSLDPMEQLQVEKRMRNQRQKMLGVYHSHTASEAYPSSVDVSLAISADISYVLVSLKNVEKPVIKSFRIDGLKILREDIQLRRA